MATTQTTKIILGSQSQGRKRILEEMGMQFDVATADIDEKMIRRDDPKDLVLTLAAAKADALQGKISEPALLITSDQVVVWNGVIREKPENEKEAREFLRGYNEHPATTVTAVVVTNLKTGKRAGDVDIAEVSFNPFSESEIDSLIADGQLFRFAGGFTIEGERWAKHVQRIEGTRDSVIGLPKNLTLRLLDEVH
ncbi:septum formation protein Maf [Candidatus Uhrbacteria bacterium]|nr:septum formation protein Maf [Candidatus Uhrbacteria bacterium]